MPAPYNELNSTDTSNLFTVFQFSNNASGGIFMPLLLGGIWLIAFLGAISEGRQASRGFIFASFISSILGILLALTGMLNPMYMYFSFLMVGAGMIWSYLQNAPGI